MLRLGQGLDFHRLVPERPLVLGGITIPYELGLQGHSDADVLLHAVGDAILGALALGDIGHWFPDTDPRFKDADSQDLLRAILQDPRVSPWNLGNLDVTIVAEHPRLAPHIDAIRHSLATLFQTPVDRISVKATTTEKMGAIGRGEGIAATAVILLNTSTQDNR